jgi:hypothetical protein
VGRSARIAAAGAALAGLVTAAEGNAQAGTELPGEVRVTFENDSFLNPFPTRTDRYYTHGMKAEWLRPERRSDAHFLPGIRHEAWCSLICGKGAAQGHVNTGYAIAHNMYTPDDISIAAAQPQDRPWAGMLYASRIARVSYEQESLKAQRQDRIELSFGLVGPASFAKELQVGWHKLGGWVHPAGWDNQLRNEPIAQLRYETALRWPRDDGGNRDFIPRVAANVGNALTSVEADLTVRLGNNLSGFGVAPGRGQPGSAAAGTVSKALAAHGAKRLPTFNFFARAGMMAVARNITLDGNSFAENRSRIRRKPFVAEFALGVEVKLSRRWWLSYQFIHRGSEFESRSGVDAPAQEFGSLSILIKLDP